MNLRPAGIAPGFAGLAWLLAVSAPAQNLLTNNAGFEANTAYYTPYWGYPDGSPDALPGWSIILDPSGDGYAGAAANQSPANLEGTHFGYIYSGWGAVGILATAPASRASVQMGMAYTLWFLARGDASSTASATVSLTWYANDNDAATVGDSTNLDLTFPARQSTSDPMLVFHLTAVAPPGARYAGARVTRTAYDYAPIIVDDFVIMVEPDNPALSITSDGSSAILSWPRSSKYFLEESSDLSAQNQWRRLDSPVNGAGATNSVEYPVTDSAHFFRLASPD